MASNDYYPPYPAFNAPGSFYHDAHYPQQHSPDSEEPYFPSRPSFYNLNSSYYDPFLSPYYPGTYYYSSALAASFVFDGPPPQGTLLAGPPPIVLSGTSRSQPGSTNYGIAPGLTIHHTHTANDDTETCPICNKGFTRRGMANHMGSHVRRGEAQQESITLPPSPLGLDHSLAATFSPAPSRSNEIKCGLCDRPCKNLHALSSHMRVHSTKKRIPVEESTPAAAEESVDEDENLAAPPRSRLSPGSMVCPLCDKHCKMAVGLATHSRWHTSRGETTREQYQAAKVLAEREEGVEEGVEEEVGEGDEDEDDEEVTAQADPPTLQCGLCDKPCKGKMGLAIHGGSHSKRGEHTRAQVEAANGLFPTVSRKSSKRARSDPEKDGDEEEEDAPPRSRRRWNSREQPTCSARSAINFREESASPEPRLKSNLPATPSMHTHRLSSNNTNNMPSSSPYSSSSNLFTFTPLSAPTPSLSLSLNTPSSYTSAAQRRRRTPTSPTPRSSSIVGPANMTLLSPVKGGGAKGEKTKNLYTTAMAKDRIFVCDRCPAGRGGFVHEDTFRAHLKTHSSSSS